MELTKEEVNKRLERLRNYEHLYPELRKKCDKLKNENQELRILFEEEMRGHKQ